MTIVNMSDKINTMYNYEYAKCSIFDCNACTVLCTMAIHIIVSADFLGEVPGDFPAHAISSSKSVLHTSRCMGSVYGCTV